jgi:integrase
MNTAHALGHQAVSLPDADSRRDWFLRDSRWSDVRWSLAPTGVLEEERPVEISWDFQLPSGGAFTDAQCAPLLESARRLLALIRRRSFSTGRPQRANTVLIHFVRLRSLVIWMDREGFHRFADLDEAAVRRFRRVTAARRTRKGSLIAPTTVEIADRFLRYLFLYREEVGDGLLADPCEGRSAHAAAGVLPGARGAIPYTPDAVAVPLVQGAIAFLTESAFDILCARERYTAAYDRARQRGCQPKACRSAGLAAVRSRPIRLQTGCQASSSAIDLSELVDRLYIACFVVISYLVGPRVSEALSLRVGCVEALRAVDGAAPTELAVIVGNIFKLEADYYGRRHEWVAPPPAIHAVFVLEALSEPHRRSSGRSELWLRPRATRLGATEWRSDAVIPVRIPRTERINLGIRRLACWLSLPKVQGRTWKLSTHQGRKTFARFAALRDRTALFALAQHLGHRDRAITDRGYVGQDYSLSREIGAHILEASVTAWEHMLAEPRIGGRAGERIVAQRPRFHGTHMKQDIRSYARLLVESGLTLGLCDWGFCIYRQEHSACLGSAHSPNPILREPSTCARCRNFAVSVKHRPYWKEQVARYQALLSEPDLPRQTLKIARDRLTEATRIIRSIDASEGD